MVLKVGEPVYLGFQPAENGNESGQIYSVPAVREANHRITATGKVIVVVPDSGGYDESTAKTVAKQMAISMIDADPGLLTPVDEGPNSDNPIDVPGIVTR